MKRERGVGYKGVGVTLGKYYQFGIYILVTQYYYFHSIILVMF